MNINRSFYKGEIYHLCNKSIANYLIFRNEFLSSHFQIVLSYYNSICGKICLSKALKKPLLLPHFMIRKEENIFHVIAFCIMPDHYHLLIKVNHEMLISKYINDIQNSYSRYFNTLNKRKGPLWQNRFRAIRIEDDATLLHVQRYIHLNPTTAGLVNSPVEWKASSYRDYLINPEILNINTEISMKSVKQLKKFTEDQIDYQKTIKGIRQKLLE